MKLQKVYFIIGVLFTMILLTKTFFQIATHSVSFTELLMWGALSYLSFAAGYIYPHFKEKDERANLIKQKGMQYTLYFVLIYCVMIMFSMQFSTVALSAVEIMRILVSLTIITTFSSWVILSKKY
ncbi:hypothetical protein MOC71_04105 [Bacillus vallismortis]|uniref:Permease n=1 Tax=Bacillus vallismortis TaxID=72361 RepID=A0AAP3CG62_BACVA|nr:hypothetical protein [Bacillus vallismortis]MCY8315943.1 hypothetical protein [Bacillus vallismortis]